jgi:murein DD-endopeptidase MepM/ murein hydrolase activator NlpD
MRIAVMIGPLGRAAVLVALAGGVAGCASDTKRFDEGLVGQYSQNQPSNQSQLYSQNQAAPPAPAARVDAAQLPEPVGPRPAQVAVHTPPEPPKRTAEKIAEKPAEKVAEKHAEKTIAAHVPPPAPKQETVAVVSPTKVTPLAPAAKPVQPEQQVAVVSPPASAAVAVPEKPTDNGGAPSFRWPARGRVISGAGAMTNGQQNDGINLALPEGTPVHAAEDGVVAYAGSELKGYGNLVLIRHSNGFVTAYAHASEIMVKRGDQVRRGQVIAKSGQTGNVSSPQLHFEIRKGSTPVDPTQYLPGA